MQNPKIEINNHGKGSFAVGEAGAVNVLHGSNNSNIFQNHGNNFGVMGTASGNVTIINITLRVDGGTADEAYERLLSVINLEPRQEVMGCGQNRKILRLVQYCCDTLSAPV